MMEARLAGEFEALLGQVGHVRGGQGTMFYVCQVGQVGHVRGGQGTMFYVCQVGAWIEKTVYRIPCWGASCFLNCGVFKQF